MPFPIRCAACNKAFNISDDVFERKIRGKVVGIKCRSCGKPIRVDGTKEPGAGAPAAEIRAKPAPTPKPSPVQKTPAPAKVAERPTDEVLRQRKSTEREAPAAKRTPRPAGVLWAVDLGEPRHREFTADQIKKEITAGNVDTQTLVWHEKMPEWKALGDVEELRGLLPAKPKPSPGVESPFGPDSGDEVVTSARIPETPSPKPARATAGDGGSTKRPLPAPPPRKSAPGPVRAAPKPESTEPMGAPASSPPARKADAPAQDRSSPTPPLPTPPPALPAQPPPLPAAIAEPLGAGIAAAVGPVATSPIPQPPMTSPPAFPLAGSSPGGFDVDPLETNFRGKSKTPLILVGMGIVIAGVIAAATLSGGDASESAETPPPGVAPPPPPVAPEAPAAAAPATPTPPMSAPAAEGESAPTPADAKGFAEMFEQSAKKQDSK